MALVLCTLHLSCLLSHVAGLCYPRNGFKCYHVFLSPPDLLLKLCQKELSFLKNCLQVNPKSYSVWHHRQWIMEYMPQPDWNEELRLCNLFLSYDERNCMLIYYYFQTFLCQFLTRRTQARTQCFSDSYKEEQISNIRKKMELY